MPEYDPETMSSDQMETFFNMYAAAKARKERLRLQSLHESEAPNSNGTSAAAGSDGQLDRADSSGAVEQQQLAAASGAGSTWRSRSSANGTNTNGSSINGGSTNGGSITGTSTSGGSTTGASAPSFPSFGSGAAAADRFSSFGGQARSTVRGRVSTGKAAPSHSVSISKNEICLLPFPAWGLRMDNHGKPKDQDGNTKDLIAFLYNQGCVIMAKGIKRAMSSADVMNYIITEFKKQNWNLAVNGFRYAKVLGHGHELVPAKFDPSAVDGAKLEVEYSSSRCFIVVETEDCPDAFQAYFLAPDVPLIEVQKRNELTECNKCLVVLPQDQAIEHLCPRQDKPLVPRLPGFHGKVGGMKSIDWTKTQFWLGDLAGIHLIDDLPESLKEMGATTAPASAPAWNNVGKWCMCQGLGRRPFGKHEEWIQCASERDCPVRWFHRTCVACAADNDDFELEDDWTCMFCKLVAKANKNKRRRLNRQHA